MDNVTEEWRAIPGWEGLYEASSQGRVRSLERRVKMPRGNVQTFPAKIRKRSWNGRYFHVSLTDRRRRKVKLVHQAVAEAFHGERPDGMYVNHIDGDRRNNRADNLEWVTAAENCQHAIAHGLTTPTQGTRHGAAVLSEADVRAIRAARGCVRNGVLARRYGVSPATICDVQSRRSWKHLP